MEAKMAALLSVVDDDISVRRSPGRLRRSVGIEARVFASAEEFLNSEHPCETDGLIFDVRLPGMSGIELHRHLLTRMCNAPVIFITAHGSDDGATFEAASNWTVAYLIKPFSGDELLDPVDLALKRKSASSQKDN